MCGRFVLKTLPPAWRSAFQLEFSVVPGLQLRPRYNIAPGQDVAILRAVEDSTEAVPARWGLIPAWADDPSLIEPLEAAQDPAAKAPATQGELF